MGNSNDHRELVKQLRDIVREADAIVSKLSRREVAEKLAELDNARVEFIDHKTLVVSGLEHRLYQRGLIPASWLNEYRYCARRLAIRIKHFEEYGGVLVSVDQARRILRGLLVHRAYSERLALGEAEVYVESQSLGVGGRADEIREEPGRLLVVEVKSGWRPDPVAARLQATAYALAAAETREVQGVSLEALVLYPGGVMHVDPLQEKHVLVEYLRRVRTVVEGAKNGDYPPRLSAKLSSRCNACPYRSACLHLPDPYRSYERYFSAKNIKKIREPPRNGGLLAFLKKNREDNQQ